MVLPCGLRLKQFKQCFTLFLTNTGFSNYVLYSSESANTCSFSASSFRLRVLEPLIFLDRECQVLPKRGLRTETIRVFSRLGENLSSPTGCAGWVQHGPNLRSRRSLPCLVLLPPGTPARRTWKRSCRIWCLPSKRRASFRNSTAPFLSGILQGECR